VSLAPARPSDALAADLDRARRTREQVEALIATPSLLGPDFSPIRALDAAVPAAGSLLGWKATGRGTTGTEIADTLALLASAASLGLVERLDWAFRCHAFDVAMDSDIAGELHITPEPETFGSACPPRLAVSFLRGRRSLSVCAELHADAFADERRLLAAAEEMRGWGWQLVYADVTDSAAAALRLLPQLRPAYVHLDAAAALRGDATTRDLVAAGHEVGSAILAVGVDTSSELAAVVEAGAEYARGRLVGPPVPAPH
jgi:EAL domain-containing protein (putative c-di-GMP-specific phosphodiesterase class I)